MRSMVEPRAESTMIGVVGRLVVTADRADHGPPVQLGEHQVEDDERRLAASRSASSAAGPSAAVTTANPSRSRYVRTRRTIFASSSTTRIGRSGRGSAVGLGIGSMVGERR